jgi:hypothetical protein
MTTRLAHLPAGLAAGVVLLLGLAACSQDPEVPTAEVGDCIESVGSVVSELPTVDCDEPHEVQVVGLFEHEGDDFPGDEVISQEAFDECLELFENFVGAPFEETSLSVLPITPTEESWNEADDRESICVTSRDDGAELTETVEDNAAAFPLGG